MYVTDFTEKNVSKIFVKLIIQLFRIELSHVGAIKIFLFILLEFIFFQVR